MTWYITFLLEPQSRACSLLIFIFPHEGFVHRDQLSCYLPIVFLHCEPAVTGEVVSIDSTKASDQHSVSQMRLAYTESEHPLRNLSSRMDDHLKVITVHLFETRWEKPFSNSCFHNHLYSKMALISHPLSLFQRGYCQLLMLLNSNS